MVHRQCDSCERLPPWTALTPGEERLGVCRACMPPPTQDQMIANSEALRALDALDRRWDAGGERRDAPLGDALQVLRGATGGLLMPAEDRVTELQQQVRTLREQLRGRQAAHERRVDKCAPPTRTLAFWHPTCNCRGGRLQSELDFAEIEREKAWQLQAAQAEFLSDARRAEEAAKRRAQAAELEAGRLRKELACTKRNRGGFVIPHALLTEPHVQKFLRVALAPDKIRDLDMRAIAQPLMQRLTEPQSPPAR